MRPKLGVPIDNTDAMSDIERLEAAFSKITDASIKQIKRKVGAARAAQDKESQKLSQIQMSMFQHGKEIFGFSKRNAKSAEGHDLDRLEESFVGIMNQASSNLQAELEAAQAIGDEVTKKIRHLQIGMYQNLEQIFQSALQYATDSYWSQENEGE
ncbi:MAG: hypothetical protein AAF614_17085 [Chloroflexota bacterium]